MKTPPKPPGARSVKGERPEKRIDYVVKFDFEREEKRMSKITDVKYFSGCEEVPRGGLFGWAIDILVGKRIVSTGPSLFVATRDDGEIITSPDATTWTKRTTP